MLLKEKGKVRRRMRRGVLKPKSAFNKFAKTEEHAKWSIRKRLLLKIKSFLKARGEDE